MLMLIFERKPLEQILDAVKEKKRILVLGCGTCPSVRLAGGEREVAMLGSQLKIVLGDSVEILEATPRRQCDPEFFEEVKELAAGTDQVLSLACGMGVQLAAEHLKIPAFPVNNTMCVGTPLEQGVWMERCRACGDCIVHQYGGICPIARCAKSLLNGPCGGSQKGKCEVSPDIPCVWQEIYDRFKELGQLESLNEVKPPKKWAVSHYGSPRRVVREDLRIEPEKQ